MRDVTVQHITYLHTQKKKTIEIDDEREEKNDGTSHTDTQRGSAQSDYMTYIVGIKGYETANRQGEAWQADYCDPRHISHLARCVIKRGAHCHGRFARDSFGPSAISALSCRSRGM